MGKAITANPDITQLPDALTLPTRELLEIRVKTLRDAMKLRVEQAKAEHRDTLDASELDGANRFLNQLERTLPKVPEADE